MKKYLIALPLLMAMIACGPADIQKVAKGLNDLAVATGTAQTTIIAMEQNKLLDTDTTRTILEGIQKANQAQLQAIHITQALSKIDKPTQQQLIAIIGPITQSVKDLVDNGTVGIKNPDVKQKVLSVLITIQSALTVINIGLGV